ncbi:MAG: CHAD domain-containing protein [Gallionella sp.]
MAIETELKLRVTPAHLAKLKRHALLKAHQLARPVTRRLYNVYFDTPELDLHQAAMALRLRRSGKQWLQTLKGGGFVQAGLHQRNEWEVPVAGEALDFSAAVTTEWDTLLPVAWREKLQPVFVTDFSRSSRMVDWQGAHIEVCMDSGHITASTRSHEICELELELKSGAPQQLFSLALAILDIVPVEIEMVNKAEYGFRLQGNFIAQPYKHQPATLTSHDDLTQGLQAAIWSCLLHCQKNWRGAMGGTNPDFLHQVRVALRRLRVLLRFAYQLRSDEQLARLSAEIADISVLLGAVRDWDVFIAQTLQPLRDAASQPDGFAALVSAAHRQRTTCHAALLEQAREMQSLILRFSIWMHGDYWQRAEKIAPPAQEFAAHKLNKLAHRFALTVGVLDENDAEELHELRILAKKLRYSAEAFSGWFDDKYTGSFLNALAEVQQVLGLINDATVAHHLLDELLQKNARHQQATVYTRNFIVRERSHLLDDLRKALQYFDKQPIFWRA